MNCRGTAKRCSTCAARKISCDLKYPACSQCLLTGRECQGYHRETIFLQQRIVKPDSKRKRTNVATPKESHDCSKKDAIVRKSSSAVSGPRTKQKPAIKFRISVGQTLPKSEDDIFITTIIENFTPQQEIGLVNAGDDSAVSRDSRMCGSWVTLLPGLAAKSALGPGVLCVAIRALGTAIIGREKKDEQMISNALDLYCQGLQALRHGLSMATQVSDVELLCVSKCLNITEVMLGTSHTGWSIHIHGIAKLIEDRGPNAFVSGFSHQFFTNLRTFMLLEYIQNRKPAFLSSLEWLTVPFSIEPKSSLQTLLDIITPLPGFLSRADALKAEYSKLDKSDMQNVRLELMSVLTSLHKWEADLNSSHSGSLWWPVPSTLSYTNAGPRFESIFPISYHFPNILTANTLTHSWAFTATVLSAIELLTKPQSKLFSPPQISTDHIRKEMMDLASKICQSLEFHLLPELKLYGPISTFFPLRIALQIFEKSPETKKEEQWCRNFIESLEERGFPLAKFLPGCLGI